VINNEFGLEIASREFPAICSQALLALLGGNHLKTWKLHPCHAQIGSLTYVESETADGQSVGSWSDRKVDIESASDLCQFRTIVPLPAAAAIGAQDSAGRSVVQIELDSTGQTAFLSYNEIADLQRVTVCDREHRTGKPQPTRCRIKLAAVEGAVRDVLPEDR
jgi:hypothetical protein